MICLHFLHTDLALIKSLGPRYARTSLSTCGRFLSMRGNIVLWKMLVPFHDCSCKLKPILRERRKNADGTHKEGIYHVGPAATILYRERRLTVIHPIPDTWNAFFRGKFRITKKFTNDLLVIWNLPLKNAFHVSGIGCSWKYSLWAIQFRSCTN